MTFLSYKILPFYGYWITSTWILDNSLGRSSLGETSAPSLAVVWAVCSSLSRSGLPWDFSHSALAFLLTLSSFRTCLCNHFKETRSRIRLPAILTLRIFPSLPLWCSLSPKYRSSVGHVSTGSRLPMIHPSLHCVQLWVSAMIFI